MRHIGQSLKVFEATSEWLSQDKSEVPGKQPMNRKLCPVIVETLKKLYTNEMLRDSNRGYFANIIQPQNAQVLFNLLYKLIKCQKNSNEGLSGMGMPHKLVTEEKVVFDFIEQLNDVVRLNPQTHVYYLKFLLSFAEYSPNEPHSEAFTRRIYSIISSLILQAKVPLEILKEVLSFLYERTEQLISLRYNNDACMGMVFPSKGSQTLFYTIGLYAMQLSSFLINPKHFKSRMTAHFKQVEEQKRQPAFGIGSSQAITG